MNDADALTVAVWVAAGLLAGFGVGAWVSPRGFKLPMGRVEYRAGGELLVRGPFIPFLLKQQGSTLRPDSWTRLIFSRFDVPVRARPTLGPDAFELETDSRRKVRWRGRRGEVEVPYNDALEELLGELLAMGVLEGP